MESFLRIDIKLAHKEILPIFQCSDGIVCKYAPRSYVYLRFRKVMERCVSTLIQEICYRKTNQPYQTGHANSGRSLRRKDQS